MSKYEGEFAFEGDEVDYDEYKELFKKKQYNADVIRRSQKHIKSINEVGVVPTLPPEIMERRARYREDFVAALQELYPESTGLKPFGDVQIKSTQFLQYIVHNKGRLILLEPRGYAKTTRITNSVMMAALEGLQPYIVVVTSSLQKSQDILEDIRTELTTNDLIRELYPAVCNCFIHLERSPQKTKRQTYAGEFTYIENSQDAIHFPAIPGEPSSCCIIQCRPATNLKGLKHKIPSGPNKGKNQRPTLYIFDDPQTEEDAASPRIRSKIIKNIKRSALKGGTHQDPVSALMAVTPVEYGDVPWHFVHKEESFDLVRYKMITKFPENEDLWYGPYAEIRRSFDREIMGDRKRARLEAKEYVLEHFDEMHKGSEVTWDYAYNPHSPQYEVSALQHAYNIILDDGIEDFEFECQCNTEYGMYEESDQMHCPAEVIVTKTNTFKRRQVPQGATKIVTHIDVNKDILTYLTVASPPNLRPYVIDMGVYPEQPGKFSKRKLSRTLGSVYPQAKDYRDVLYLACIDLFQYIAQIEYTREDGIKRHNDRIGVDVKFEEVYISRACRETPYSNVVIPCWGIYVGPDDDPLHNRNHPESVQVYDNCIITPNKENTLDVVNIDVNYYKTEVHRALNKDAGLPGSMTLWNDIHDVFAEHCNSEYPKRVPGKKSIATKVQWYEKYKQVDNEWFDNVTACLALLATLGVNMQPKTTNDKQEEGARQINSLQELMDREPSTNLW